MGLGLITGKLRWGNQGCDGEDCGYIIRDGQRVRSTCECSARLKLWNQDFDCDDEVGSKCVSFLPIFMSLTSTFGQFPVVDPFLIAKERPTTKRQYQHGLQLQDFSTTEIFNPKSSSHRHITLHSRNISTWVSSVDKPVQSMPIQPLPQVLQERRPLRARRLHAVEEVFWESLVAEHTAPIQRQETLDQPLASG